MNAKLPTNKFRDTVTLVNYALVPDGAAGFTKGAEVAIDLPAYVVPRTSRSVTEAGAVQLSTTYKVEVRHVEGAVPESNQLVRFNGDQYSIIGIDNVDTWARIVIFEMVKADNNG